MIVSGDEVYFGLFDLFVYVGGMFLDFELVLDCVCLVDFCLNVCGMK